MRYRHIIWDFDGTLFDSYSHMADALCRALADHGIRATRDEIMAWMKKSTGEALNHFCGKSGIKDDVKRLYRKYEDERGGPPVTPYEGAKKVCGTVCKLGGANYLYTHRGSSALELLRQYGMDGDFLAVITKEDGFPPKPVPDAVNNLIARYGLERRECLFVGDRDIDILCGENAGIGGCLFDPDGFYGHFDTPLRVRSLSGLLDIIGGQVAGARQ